MSGNQVSLLLVGIGGYGSTYVKQLLNEPDLAEAVIAGIVDIHPERSNHYEMLKSMNIPFYPSMESFYAEKKADLAVISTPIQFHCEQTCLALANGSHVLCEKPIAATIQEVRRMMEARDRAGKFVAIGYNLSYTAQIQQLKRDIASGLFGKPKRLKSIVLWRRTDDYFSSGWKGRRKSDKGEWILDSVAHNATSHYLHNMFYVLGARTDASLMPDSVEAELYRVNPIENFDTCAVKAIGEDGVELYFYATHAVQDNFGPSFCFEFDKATITYTSGQHADRIDAVFHDGTVKGYEPQQSTKLLTCIEAAAVGGTDIPCGLEAAYAQVLCMNGMLESMPKVKEFPAGLVRRDEEVRSFWVDGLREALLDSYHRWALPSDLGFEWAAKGDIVRMAGYEAYTG
ncbi:Gfo/Idh/MocA family oxidoreductase [Paenibacillus doosanensis]|uniref:1,5-anhydro-D-fructose reductase n=1 Tax=Paenibacillus konkukensis TaxID=2020716 RepID=A0ABY4RTE0_9BACL|nr:MULTISPECIES: Gfo/Idh/MocA family oxidoreductase [Paenibacillus]MCS7463744.1 Gfo/Idh/MocA family oxidoreductase [Paenibacillus doosanensis]UQZ85240.1 1,5-anhydro-D-fructose reductase [Paenibacillus konkukensis]